MMMSPFEKSTRRLIRSLGYVAVAFASAEEFLQSDRVRDTSCLITDVQMPGMSGVDLQDRLIADDRHTPIIFMTAFPTEKLRARALEGGALGFLNKPFDEEQLDRMPAFGADEGSRDKPQAIEMQGTISAATVRLHYTSV